MNPVNDHLRIAHLLALAVWFGIIATESVIELLPRRNPSLWPAASHLHYWIDLALELPALLAVALTGVALAGSVPSSTRLIAKVASGGTAVLANLVCVGLVLRRERLRRQGGSPSDLRRASRGVVMAAAIGSPFGILSLLIGAHAI
jgi:hypothetical protein